MGKPLLIVSYIIETLPKFSKYLINNKRDKHIPTEVIKPVKGLYKSGSLILNIQPIICIASPNKARDIHISNTLNFLFGFFLSIKKLKNTSSFANLPFNI